MSELKVGDKCYYVIPEEDSEVECYVYKIINENNVQVKIREGKSFGFFPEYRLTKIDPPNWETLDENLEKYGLESYIAEKVEDLVMESKNKLEEDGTSQKSATGVVINVQ